MTEFRTLYQVPSGKYYAGKPDSKGKITGVMVRDGRLFGPLREGMSGDAVAHFVEPVSRDTKDTLRTREVTLEGNPASKLSVGQFLDMVERPIGKNSDA